MSQNPREAFALMGAAAGSRFGPIGAAVGGASGYLLAPLSDTQARDEKIDALQKLLAQGDPTKEVGLAKTIRQQRQSELNKLLATRRYDTIKSLPIGLGISSQSAGAAGGISIGSTAGAAPGGSRRAVEDPIGSMLGRVDVSIRNSTASAQELYKSIGIQEDDLLARQIDRIDNIADYELDKRRETLGLAGVADVEGILAEGRIKRAGGAPPPAPLVRRLVFFFLRLAFTHRDAERLPVGLADPLSVPERDALPKDIGLAFMSHAEYPFVSDIDLGSGKCDFWLVTAFFARPRTLRKSMEGRSSDRPFFVPALRRSGCLHSFPFSSTRLTANIIVNPSQKVNSLTTDSIGVRKLRVDISQ